MDKNFTFFNYLFKKWRNSLHDLHFKTLEPSYLRTPNQRFPTS